MTNRSNNTNIYKIDYNNKINTYVIEMAQKDNYNQKLLLFYFIYKNYNFVKKKKCFKSLK